MILNDINLDNRANKYIGEVLSYETLMSNKIQEMVSVDDRSVKTYLPEGALLDQSYMFKQGGILRGGQNFEIMTCEVKGHKLISVPTLTDFLVEYIFRTINESDNSFCVFDDLMVSPGEQELNRFNETYFEVEGEIYHIVSKTNLNKELLRRIVFAVNLNWHFLCVISSTKDYMALHEKKWIKNDFDKLFTNITDLIVGAYDGEGFLFCDT